MSFLRTPQNCLKLFSTYLGSSKTCWRFYNTLLDYTYNFRHSDTSLRFLETLHKTLARARFRFYKTLLFVKRFWFEYFLLGGAIAPIAFHGYPQLIHSENTREIFEKYRNKFPVENADNFNLPEC